MPGAAADWEIDTVRIDLSPHKQTSAVTVRNTSDQPAAILVQALSWMQRDGRDVYAPTDELLVSPAAVIIAPKGKQVVRVALRRQADAASELTYRISLQERSLQPGKGFTGAEGALRISLPVFVQSQKGDAAPRATWKVSRMPAKLLQVELHNRGNAHVLISDFSIYLPGAGQSVAGESASSYVLAGQSRVWLLKTSIPENMPAGRLRLKAYTDAGNSDTEIALENP